MSIASRLFCSNDIGKSYSFSFNDNNKKGSQHKRNNGWQPLYAEHHFILKTQGNCAIIATFEKKKKGPNMSIHNRDVPFWRYT